MLLHVISDVRMNDGNGIRIDEVSVSIRRKKKKAVDHLRDRRELTTAKDLLLMTICTKR